MEKQLFGQNKLIQQIWTIGCGRELVLWQKGCGPSQIQHGEAQKEECYILGMLTFNFFLNKEIKKNIDLTNITKISGKDSSIWEFQQILYNLNGAIKMRDIAMLDTNLKLMFKYLYL